MIQPKFSPEYMEHNWQVFTILRPIAQFSNTVLHLTIKQQRLTVVQLVIARHAVLAPQHAMNVNLGSIYLQTLVAVSLFQQ
jgi:hypothetical protein